jgi:hypothetical protein
VERENPRTEEEIERQRDIVGAMVIRKIINGKKMYVSRQRGKQCKNIKWMSGKSEAE